MSDTQAKIDKRKQEAWKQKKKNQKRASGKIKYTTKKKIRNIAIIAAACVLAVAIVLPNLSFTKRWIKAVKVGDISVSTAEFSYSYINAFYNYYNTMASYVGEQYIGISTSKSLRKQEMSANQTYSEYFCEVALQGVQQTIVLSEEAKKVGFTMTAEQEEEYKKALTSLENTAKSYNQSVDKYLKQVYGKGMTRALFEEINYRAYLADAYQEKITNDFEYTKSQLEEYYQGNKNSFDKLTVRYQKFGVSAKTDKAEEVTLEDAKKQAEDFKAKVKDEASFSAQALELAKSKAEDPSKVTTENTLRSNTSYASLKSASEALADWAISSSRKEGDCELIDAGDKSGYYVVYMVTPAHREEYNTVNMRHILISLSATDAKNETKKKEAKEKAEKLLKEWKEGAATEESFAELADKNSADGAEGGLYEKVYHDYMVKEMNDWLFDEKRKAGDCEIVYTEDYGYHIVYFIGEDAPYWQVQVENTMRNNDYNEFYTEASKGYPVTKYKLGIWYRNEPF